MKRATLWTVAVMIGICSLSSTAAYATTIPLTLPYISAGPAPAPTAAVVPTAQPSVWFTGPGSWWAPSLNQAFSPSTFLGGDLPGLYYYDQTFDLTGYNPLTAVLTGFWTTDNNGVIKLNGVSGGTRGLAQYGSIAPFSFGPGDFLPGVNTLRFEVTNEDATGQPWGGPHGENPTGVYIDVKEASAAVPEPMTMGLLGIGFVGLSARKLRGRMK